MHPSLFWIKFYCGKSLFLFSFIGENELPYDLKERIIHWVFNKRQYELKIDEKFLTYRRMRYMLDSDYFEFGQDILQSVSMYIDTEDTVTEQVLVAGNNAIYAIKEKMSFLYWNDENYSYFIQSDEVIIKEELIKIAESVKRE